MAEAYWDEAFARQKAGSGEQYGYFLSEALTEWERIIREMPQTESHTAEACFFSGECRRLLGEPALAIERYQQLVEKWPNYKHSCRAQLTIARCLEELMSAKQIPKPEGAEALRQACQAALANYQDSPSVGQAASTLRRLESFKAKGLMTPQSMQEGRVKDEQ
jgi:hypothetical protein